MLKLAGTPSMITFLAALTYVFFDRTNTPTKIALGIVLGLLFAIVGLLLYLEREGTVSTGFQSWKALLGLMQSVWQILAKWTKRVLVRSRMNRTFGRSRNSLSSDSTSIFTAV